MAIYNFERTLLQSYAVEPKQLELLANLLKQSVAEPSYHVHLKNGTKISGEDFDSLFALPNSGPSRITYLSVAASNYSKRQEVTVALTEWSGLTLNLRGPEEDFVLLQKKVEEIFSYSKPSYAWLIDMSWKTSIAAWIALTAIGTPLLTSIPGMEAYPAFVASKFGHYGPAVIGNIFSQSAAWYLITKRFCFPRSLILIGHGKAKSQRYQARRTFLLIVVVAGFLVSLAAGWAGTKLY